MNQAPVSPITSEASMTQRLTRIDYSLFQVRCDSNRTIIGESITVSQQSQCRAQGLCVSWC